MTRPKDLPSALKSWALANYSAGPSWGGTPQRAAPGAAFLTPGVTLPAENENYLHGNAFDAAQGAINAVGQMPAPNWGAPLATTSASVACAWSDAEQAWYSFYASSAAAQHSFDYGKTWTATAALTTLGGTCDAAVDTSGNICIASVLAIQEGPLVAYGTNIVWTNHVAALGVSGVASGILFEPTSGNWVASGGTSGGVSWIYTSTTRATWTLRTIPGTWTSAGSGNIVQIGAQGVGGSGIVVATLCNGSTTQFRTMRSADGGITWTNDQPIVQNAGISIAAFGSTTRPVWSAVDGLWYVAVYQTSARKTQVFSSPDGITWSTAATLLTNDCAFIQLQCLGALIVALNNDGRIFCSFNQGANWFRCGFTALPSSGPTVPGPTTFKAGGGGIMTMNNGSTSIASLRFGLPVTAA